MDMLITVSKAGSFTLLTSSHYSLVLKSLKPMGMQGMYKMYENAVRNLPSKYPKGISFSESATNPELWAWHIVDSVSTACICPHPSARVSETSTFKCMYYQLKCTTGFFLILEAFHDHTALQLTMEWVMEVYSSHCYQPQLFALLFWGLNLQSLCLNTTTWFCKTNSNLL